LTNSLVRIRGRCGGQISFGWRKPLASPPEEAAKLMVSTS
jgi:hypothetical protein